MYLRDMKVHLPVIDQAKRFKKKHHREIKGLYQSPGIDAKIQAAHAQVFSDLSCLDCANCCKTTGPLFTQRDIDRLAAHLRLSPGTFIQKYLHMDEDGDFVLTSLPCPFLTNENICSVYDARPQACAAYPHTDQHHQKRIFQLTMKNMEICPAVLEVFKQLVP